MRYRPANLKQKFEEYKAGDENRLGEIFASEKTRLYDFLIRMTGQISKSLDIADEAIVAVGPALDLENSLEEVLVLLYKTARNFTIENWNSDTSRLENSSYTVSPGSGGDRNSVHLVSLEHVVRQLQPKLREVFLLHGRFGFSLDEVAVIVGNSVSDVEELFASALRVADAAMPGEADRIPELMTLMHGFSIPIDEVMETQNLSMVFKNLKKSPRTIASGWLRIGAGLIFLGIIYYVATLNGWIMEFTDYISTL